MIKKKLSVTMLLAIVSITASAADWRCRNENMEVSCAGAECKSATPFTPMQIDLRASGDVTICAYSDCWAGKGRITRSDSFVTLAATKLPSSRLGSAGHLAAVAVLIDTEDGVGVMKMGSYAQPLICVRGA